MFFALIIALALGLLVGAGLGAAWAQRPEIAARAGVNHRDMARWIDKTTSDDIVRPLLPEDVAESGKKLLSDFYGKD